MRAVKVLPRAGRPTMTTASLASLGITPTMAAAGLGSTSIDTRGYYTTDDVQQNAIAALEVMLKVGGDVNATDDFGQPPIFGAAMWGWTDVVKYLVAHGADLDVKDKQGLDVVAAAEGKAKRGLRRGGTGDGHPETVDYLKSLMPKTASNNSL